MDMSVCNQIPKICFILSAKNVFIKTYLGEFEVVDDHRSGKIVVELNGRLNKCGVISPRFDVGVNAVSFYYK